MARKIVNRLELRRESDAAEARSEDEQEVETEEEGGDDEEEGDEDGEGKPKKKPKAKTAKAKKEPAKRKSRAAAKEVRHKAFWAVYNQSMKRVATFEHSERKLADKKAEELTASQKSPHWVQSYKEAISE